MGWHHLLGFAGHITCIAAKLASPSRSEVDVCLKMHRSVHVGAVNP